MNLKRAEIRQIPSRRPRVGRRARRLLHLPPVRQAVAEPLRRALFTPGPERELFAHGKRLQRAAPFIAQRSHGGGDVLPGQGATRRLDLGGIQRKDRRSRAAERNVRRSDAAAATPG